MPSVIYKDCEKAIYIDYGGGNPYIVPIHRLHNSTELVDWIYQIRSKDWCTAQLILEFIDAVEYACQFEFDTPAQLMFKDELVEWS